MKSAIAAPSQATRPHAARSQATPCQGAPFPAAPSQFEGLSPEQQGRLTDVLDEYIQSLEQGRPQSREQIFARHPDLAAAMVAYLDSLDYLQAAAAGMSTDVGGGRLDDDAKPQAAGLPAAAGQPQVEGQLGDFRIVREVGRGGMGVVYEAWQVSLNRRVALKVLPFAALLDDRQIARFQNEARAAAQLHHPHIVPVYAVGSERGAHYFAMQYIDGQPLDGAIAKLREAQRHPPCNPSGTSLITQSTNSPEYCATVARLGLQAAEALQAAHEVGIVHRDIKPSNLLLDAEGKLWVADFGLALCRTEKHLTRTGDFVGTVGYMSPEQMQGRAGLVDQRTDIYSLGVTLYELLTLRPAIRGRDAATVLREMDRDEPYSMRLRNSSIPLDLETIVLKAISKSRDERYTTAQELADDLRRFLEGQPILARRPSLADRVSKWTRRHKRPVASAVCVLVLAAVGLLASTLLLAHQKQRTEAALISARDNFRQFRSQLALTNHHLGLLQDQGGDAAQAATSLREARRLQQEMLAERPGDPQLLRDLAGTLNNLSFVYARHVPSQAAICFAEAIEIHQKLADATPGSASSHCDLALAHSNLGSFQARHGQPDLAVAEHRKSVEILERLCRLRTAEPSFQRDLAISYNNLGMAQSGHGEASRAEQSFQKALQAFAQSETTTGRAPRELSADDRSSLGGIYNNLGMVQEQQERLTEADASYLRAIEHQRAAHELSPQVSRFREYLGKHYYNRGRVLRRTRNYSLAAEAALARKELIHDDPRHLQSVSEELALLAQAARENPPGDEPAQAIDRYARLAIRVMQEAASLSLDPTAVVRDSPAWMLLREYPEVQAWLGTDVN